MTGEDRAGVVEDFDAVVGLGLIRAGADTFAFHCTQIADGTRAIEVGTPVRFSLRPARLGRWEAVGIAARTAAGVPLDP